MFERKYRFNPMFVKKMKKKDWNKIKIKNEFEARKLFTKIKLEFHLISFESMRNNFLLTDLTLEDYKTFDFIFHLILDDYLMELKMYFEILDGMSFEEFMKEFFPKQYRKEKLSKLTPYEKGKYIAKKIIEKAGKEFLK